MALYTCDLAVDNLKAQTKAYDKFDYSDFLPIKRKRVKVVNRLKRDKRKNDVLLGKFSISSMFEKDKEIVIMRSIFTK